MRNVAKPEFAEGARLAEHLSGLRAERGWSLDELAARSAVSRATLSRLEHGSVSPTAQALWQLCAAYDIPLSRLIMMAEEPFAPKLGREEQPVWQDPAGTFKRRSVSPPSDSLSGEVIECHLEPGAEITYPAPLQPGLAHHLILQDGDLSISVDGVEHTLIPGDCLRYRLTGPNRFHSVGGAHYFLFMV